MMDMEQPISTIHRHPTQDLLAVGSKGFTKLVRIQNGEFKPPKMLKLNKTSSKSGTTDVQFNPSYYNILASTTLLNNQIIIWDIDQCNLNKLSTNIGQHDQLVNRVSWNPINPKLLASCSQDGYIKIFDFIGTKGEVLSMNHRDKVRDCQFSPFNEHLLLASYSGVVKLWDTRDTTRSVQDFYKHEADVLSIDWNPINKDIFIAGSMDKSFTLWDINIKEPCRSYKTNFGFSRIKFWKKNPQYILTSFQTNNNFAYLWNLEIQNIAEYVFKGHKEVVTGFCWDLSETKLITVSKDSKMILHDFYNGSRPLDNFYTNFCKLNDETQLYYYTDLLPNKKPLDKLPDDYNVLYKPRERKDHTIFFKHLKLSFSYDRDTVKEVFKRFSFLVRIECLRQDIQIRKDLFEKSIIHTNHKNNLVNTVSGSNKYNDTFGFKGNNIKMNMSNMDINNQSMNKSNNYFDNHNNTKNYIPGTFDSLTEIIRGLLSYNLKKSIDFKFYHYYTVFKELEYLTKSKLFEQYYSEENLNYGNLKGTNQLLYDIIKNNVLQIIDFLIETNNDIILAGIVTYIFQDYIDFDSKQLSRIQYYCIDYIRSFKLFIEAAKLTKFSNSETVKKLYMKNSLILFTCTNCNIRYDSSKPGFCSGCDLPFKCIICNMNTNGGLIYFNLNCCHGGHVKHESQWYKEKNTCPGNYIPNSN